MNQINGLLMSGDLPVAIIKENQLKILRSDCLPYYFRRNGDLLTWIKSRAIDGDRVHSRLLKKHFSCSVKMSYPQLWQSELRVLRTTIGSN